MNYNMLEIETDRFECKQGFEMSPKCHFTLRGLCRYFRKWDTLVLCFTCLYVVYHVCTWFLQSPEEGVTSLELKLQIDLAFRSRVSLCSLGWLGLNLQTRLGLNAEIACLCLAECQDYRPAPPHLCQQACKCWEPYMLLCGFRGPGSFAVLIWHCAVTISVETCYSAV